MKTNGSNGSVPGQRREEILATHHELVELKFKEHHLRQELAALEQKRKNLESLLVGQASGHHPDAPAPRGSVLTQVLAFLSSKGKPVSFNDVAAQGFGKNSAVVTSTLYALKKKGKVKRTDDGDWLATG